jgi:hypothetical protein
MFSKTRYFIRTPYNGVLASQTRHDYCPQSSMIRGVMPWRIIRGEENYASRFISLMCEKEPELKIAQQLVLEFYRILKT